MKDNEKFALIKYSSINIGDDIQSIAAKRFLPKIDAYVQRERTDEFNSDFVHKLIMNAWWMWDVEHFPPSDSIEPLLISMYLRKEIRDDLINGKVRNYLIEKGPVGCRDTSTCDYLNSIGIPAYFSGCLTLTLVPNKKIPKEKFILAVDLDEHAVNRIKMMSDMPVYTMSRMLSPYFNSMNRLEIAELVLHLYQSAHCVVSPCLHVVLPCLALETSVLRVDTGDATGGPAHSTGNAKGRFSGMEHLAHTVEYDRFLNEDIDYDFDTPPKNPKDYKIIANKLVEQCSEFTGYRNEDSEIRGEVPLLRLIQILEEDKTINNKAPYYTSFKGIISHLIDRIVFRKSRFDSNS
ncbi:TPA: hypothetical protein ACPHXL_003111 [Vibrio alginolyticus]|uniref:hypothetical protein n=1 Tax=Vibrio alginolyticus TaxID=663 RepID=UPI002277D72B|nr:hypothetical protein [Vibrio alginolyticus]WAE56213.1 hypothetical protein OPR71_14415 [Vibrio alginolyticus]